MLEDSDSEVLGVAERIARSITSAGTGTAIPTRSPATRSRSPRGWSRSRTCSTCSSTSGPYKEAWTVEDAAREIRSGAGLQFDPDVVGAFDAMGAGGWTAGFESN